MSLVELNKSVEELESIKDFDPVRFAFIQNLHVRLNNTKNTENKILINRTQQRVNEYKKDVTRAQQNANCCVDSIKANSPEKIDQANILFDRCQFTQLDQMREQLQRSARRQKPLSGLRKLKQEMSHTEVLKKVADETESLDEMLFNQEQSARIDTGSAPLPSSSSEVKFELQSMKKFRESMKYFNIDKIIARAINDFPENAGPHNPHMLAITSLMRMNELSPQYVRRFASYIETVLWLEKNETKLNKKKTT